MMPNRANEMYNTAEPQRMYSKCINKVKNIFTIGKYQKQANFYFLLLHVFHLNSR